MEINAEYMNDLLFKIIHSHSWEKKLSKLSLGTYPAFPHNIPEDLAIAEISNTWAKIFDEEFTISKFSKAVSEYKEFAHNYRAHYCLSRNSISKVIKSKVDDEEVFCCHFYADNIKLCNKAFIKSRGSWENLEDFIDVDAAVISAVHTTIEYAVDDIVKGVLVELEEMEQQLKG